MMSLLLGTGIRVSECVGLNINDVDLDTCGARVYRKGGKESVIYFSDEVRDVLENYLDEREMIDAGPGNEDALFLSMQRKADQCPQCGKPCKEICEACHTS